MDQIVETGEIIGTVIKVIILAVAGYFFGKWLRNRKKKTLKKQDAIKKDGKR